MSDDPSRRKESNDPRTSHPEQGQQPEPPRHTNPNDPAHKRPSQGGHDVARDQEQEDSGEKRRVS